MKTTTLFSLFCIISLTFSLNLAQARKLQEEEFPHEVHNNNEEPKTIAFDHRPWYPPWFHPGFPPHLFPPHQWPHYPFLPFPSPGENPSPKPEPPTPSVPPFSWPQPPADGSSLMAPGPSSTPPAHDDAGHDEITPLLQDWLKEIQQWLAHPIGPFPIPPWMKPQTTGWWPLPPWMKPHTKGHFPVPTWLKPPAGH